MRCGPVFFKFVIGARGKLIVLVVIVYFKMRPASCDMTPTHVSDMSHDTCRGFAKLNHKCQCPPLPMESMLNLIDFAGILDFQAQVIGAEELPSYNPITDDQK